jgi:hypothetical protein
MECELMKAKNREEFISCWEEEFDILAMLSESLPTGPTGENVALQYLAELQKLRAYVETAAKETYDPKPINPPVFQVPTCPDCGEPLNRVEINETLTGIFNPKTGKYREDGELETKCMQCSADLYEVFPDGPCNFSAEEEHIAKAAAALETLSQVKSVTVTQEPSQ